MIGSRKGAVAASLVGALLIIAGAPTIAFGGEDAVHERVTVQSDDTTSGDVAAQKAKDDEAKKDGEKKAADAKKDGAKKDGGDKKDAKNNGGDKKKDADSKQAAEKKKDADSKKDGEKKKADEKQAAEKKKDADEKKAAEKKKDAADKKDADKKDDGKQASDRKRRDNGKNDGKKDDGKKDDGKKDDRKDRDGKDGWKDKEHKDKRNKNWDHNRDRERRNRHGWDTNRRYYRYGYYGPGYYDDCGYYGSGYDGRSSDYSYYGPDACGYEYGGYRSSFLVNMSWDQVIPRSDAQDAYGTANLEIDVPAGEVCFRLAYDGIERAIGAQIHPGRVGEVGPAIVLFQVGQNGDDGCVSADPQILSEIQNDPRGYYLEVNDEQYGQAMRGQLDAPDYRNRY